MHLVHLFQIAWFTVNTLYRRTYPWLARITRCTRPWHFPSSFFFFFFFFWTVCFTKIFIELAVKQVQFEHVNNWIFLFPGRGDESDGVEFKIDENKNLPKLRSCKTKPTRCIQNNERTQLKFVQQWGVCQPCSGVSWMRSSCTVVIHSFFFFSVGGRPPCYFLKSHYSFVFTGSAHRLMKHSDIWSPESTKKCHNTIITGCNWLVQDRGPLVELFFYLYIYPGNTFSENSPQRS